MRLCSDQLDALLLASAVAPDGGAAPQQESAFDDPELTEAFARLRQVVKTLRRRFESEAVRDQLEGLTSFLDDVRAETLAGLERIERAARDEGVEPGKVHSLARQVRQDLYGWLAGAIEAQVVRQETAVKAARLRSYLTSFDRSVAEQPALSLPLEQDRYERQAGDGLGLRLLKAVRRARRGARRLVGARAWARSVELAEVAAFYYGGPLGSEIRLAANALAVLRIDLWQGLRIALDRLEAAFGHATGQLDGPALTAEGLERARQEVAGELDVIGRNLTRGTDALLERLDRRLRQLHSETVEAAKRAGTWELAARHYRHAKTIEARRRDRLAITENKADWNALVRGTAAALVMRLRAELVLDRFEELLAGCRRKLHEVALSPVRDYPREVVEQLDDTRATLSELLTPPADAADGTSAEEGGSEPDLTELQTRLSDEHTALTGFITRIAVGETASALEGGALNRPFDDLFEALEHLLLELPESYMTRADPWAVLPTDEPPAARLDLVEFPFRELCRESLKDEVRLRLHDRHKSIGLLLRDVGAELTEVAHFINFNFEGATKALNEERLDRLRGLVLEALDEAKARIERLIRNGDERAARVLAELDAIRDEQAEILRQIVQRGDVEEAQRRVGQVGRADRELAIEAREAAVTLIGRMRARLRQRLSQARAFIDGQLGLQQVSSARLDQHSMVASFSHLETRPIPSSYRRLFETATFGVEDILAGQQAELAHLEAAVRRWKAGLPTAVAIVGERGSGRRTLLERGLRRLLSDQSVKRRTLMGRLATEEVLATELSRLVLDVTVRDLPRFRLRLEQQETPLVVVLEGLEHVLLRTYDGLDSLVGLLNVISRSDANLLWMVTVDKAAWTFMNTFLGAADHLTHVIELGRLSRDETEQLIMRRHRISGFGLAYQPHGSSKVQAAQREHVPLTGARLERYFDALWRAGGGHPVSTMFAWLDAVIEVTDDNVVVLGPPVDIGPALGEHITVERLLNLAAILLHGSLSEQELAAVGRMNRRHASSILAQLQAINLVEPVAGDPDAFTINPVFYRPLFERLRARRMI